MIGPHVQSPIQCRRASWAEKVLKTAPGVRRSGPTVGLACHSHLSFSEVSAGSKGRPGAFLARDTVACDDEIRAPFEGCGESATLTAGAMSCHVYPVFQNQRVPHVGRPENHSDHRKFVGHRL